MADFMTAFNSLMVDESMTLSNLKGDSGGLTFCGISKNNFPNWEGWALLESLDIQIGEKCQQAMPLVAKFYNNNFWLPIKGDMIDGQEYATKLLSEEVLNGKGAAARMVEDEFNLPHTGVIDEAALTAINA